MIEAHRLAAFSLAAFLLIVVPGPSVLFVVSRGISLGRRAGVATVVGNAAGAFVQVVAVAAGLGAVVASSIAVFTVLKLVGAAYIVWLGVDALRHRRSLALTVAGAVTPRPLPRLLRDGFLVGVTNPKVIVFFVAVLPQFVDPAGAPVALQLIVLGAVFVAIGLCSDGVWAIAAGTAGRWLSQEPHRLARIGGIGGVVTIALGLRLAIAGRSD